MRNIRIKIITAAAAILTAATGTTAAAIVTASPAAADVLVNDDAGTIYPGQSLEVGVWYQAYSGGPRGYWEGVYSYPQHRWIFTRSGQASPAVPAKFSPVKPHVRGQYATVYAVSQGGRTYRPTFRTSRPAGRRRLPMPARSSRSARRCSEQPVAP